MTSLVKMNTCMCPDKVGVHAYTYLPVDLCLTYAQISGAAMEITNFTQPCKVRLKTITRYMHHPAHYRSVVYTGPLVFAPPHPRASIQGKSFHMPPFIGWKLFAPPPPFTMAKASTYTNLPSSHNFFCPPPPSAWGPGWGGGGSPCRMSNLRNGNVACLCR